MKLHDVSGLARPVDPTYPTNLAIAVLTGVALVGGGACALTVFLTWALGRELDPDHDHSAFLAVALAVGAMLRWGPPTGGPLFFLLLGLRALNGTTGVPPRPADWAMLALLGGWFLRGPWPGGFSLHWAGVALGLALLFAPAYRGCHTLTSCADVTQVPLNPRRVRTAQAAGLLFGILLAGLRGWAGLYSLLAFWTAAVAAGLWHTGRELRRAS